MKNNKQKIVFVGASRTPIGRYLGGLKEITLAELSEHALNSTIEKFNINKNQIDEVIVGNVNGTQTSSNLAKVTATNLGLPVSTTGYTVNRICGSGIQSAIDGFHELFFGKKNLIAVGGAESMSRAPYYLPEDSRFKGLAGGSMEVLDSNLLLHQTSSGRESDITHMGETAEYIISEKLIARELQDQFAFDSHQKAIKATESGRFAQEISPITISDAKGNSTTVSTDEQIRKDTSLEKLAKLKPAFVEGGTATAGNSSSLNDGASFQVMTTESYALENGYEIMGEFIDYAVVGIEPERMGLGPVDAINQVLANNDLDLHDDIDLLEINEAFAGQTLAVMEDLGIEMGSDFYKNKLNVNGGAIAQGHPLGMSGSRLITTMLYEFKNNPDKKYAIASACIGGGQGIAVLLKNGYYKE